MRLQKRHFLYFFLAISWLSITQAFSMQSPFRLNLAPVSKVIYEPFSGQPAHQPLKITFDTNSSPRLNGDADEVEGNRRFRIRIKPSNNGEFYAIGRQQKLASKISSNNQNRQFTRVNNEYRQDFRVRGNSQRATTFELTLSVVESQYADPGIYSLPLDIDLIDIDTQEVIDKNQLVIEVSVGEKLQTNIAGADVNQNTNSRFAVVNFGVLKSGDSRRLSIQIRGNTLADITVSSENNGELVHVDEPDLSVNYAVNVDGVFSELEVPLNINRPIERTLRGVAYPMDIVIGDVEHEFAGKYRDIITVEVRPK